jgi:hypothetical protein
MDVCVHLLCVCVVLYVGSGLAVGSSPVQGVPPTVYRIKKLKNGQGPTKDCRAIDRIIYNLTSHLKVREFKGHNANRMLMLLLLIIIIIII